MDNQQENRPTSSATEKAVKTAMATGELPSNEISFFKIFVVLTLLLITFIAAIYLFTEGQKSSGLTKSEPTSVPSALPTETLTVTPRNTTAPTPVVEGALSEFYRDESVDVDVTDNQLNSLENSLDNVDQETLPEPQEYDLDL